MYNNNNKDNSNHNTAARETINDDWFIKTAVSLQSDTIINCAKWFQRLFLRDAI